MKHIYKAMQKTWNNGMVKDSDLPSSIGFYSTYNGAVNAVTLRMELINGSPKNQANGYSVNWIDFHITEFELND